MMVALEKTPIEVSAASAADSHVLGHAFLQAGGRHDDLEGRSRRQLVLDRLVHQRMARIRDDLLRSLRLRTPPGAPQSRRGDKAAVLHQWFQAQAVRCDGPR